MDNGYYVHPGGKAVALFGGSYRFVLAKYCGVIAGYQYDRGADYGRITHGTGAPGGSKPGLIIHSGRGVPYCAQKCIDFMRRHGAISSMSRKGNCLDNSPMDSFFSRFKVELIYAEQFHSIEDARSGIFGFMEIFYNRLRRHSSIGYVASAEFEQMTVQTV